jgi:hypothetical protein
MASSREHARAARLLVSCMGWLGGAIQWVGVFQVRSTIRVLWRPDNALGLLRGPP